MKPDKKEETLSETMKRFLRTDPKELEELERKEKDKKEKSNPEKKGKK